MPATSSKRSLLARLAVPVLGVAAIAGAFFAAPLLNIESPPPAVAQPAAQQQAINRPGFAGEDFAALSKRLMPSVVNISTRQTVARGDGLPAFGPNSPLNEFNDLLGRGQGGLRRQSSLGSGFIIDASRLRRHQQPCDRRKPRISK